VLSAEMSNDCSGEKVPIIREPLFAVAGAEFPEGRKPGVLSPGRYPGGLEYISQPPDDLL